MRKSFIATIPAISAKLGGSLSLPLRKISQKVLVFNLPRIFTEDKLAALAKNYGEVMKGEKF